ncbi:unnamed protein product [Malus baccata var. baccata]
MCIQRGFSESGEAVEVETNSKGLIQMLNKEVQADVSMEICLVDIWAMMPSFQLVKFIFTSHQCNRASYVIVHQYDGVVRS